MFMLNGKPLALDVAFSNGDINYPANWLRLSTSDDRKEIGITEVSDPVKYDQRFYTGSGNPRPIADLKVSWINTQKETAGTLLAKTDWMVIRKEETSTAIPSDTTTYRTAVRTKCKEREDQITACSDTDALCALISASPTIPGTADNGATEIKDGSGNSYDPKQYNRVVNPAALKAWPDE